MRHQCTAITDLDELIGHEGAGGFQYGPLATAMKRGEVLVLERSDQLSRLMVSKIDAFLHGMFIVETEEWIPVWGDFRVVLR